MGVCGLICVLDVKMFENRMCFNEDCNVISSSSVFQVVFEGFFDHPTRGHIRIDNIHMSSSVELEQCTRESHNLPVALIHMSAHPSVSLPPRHAAYAVFSPESGSEGEKETRSVSRLHTHTHKRQKKYKNKKKNRKKESRPQTAFGHGF